MSDQIRTFETGATRNAAGDKYGYEGFLSPRVLRRFGAYMHKHRHLADGSLRDPDNWQKGIPRQSYMESGWRHFMDWWAHHRGAHDITAEELEDALCGVMFNAMGYLHELLNEGRPELLTMAVAFSDYEAHLRREAEGKMS